MTRKQIKAAAQDALLKALKKKRARVFLEDAEAGKNRIMAKMREGYICEFYFEFEEGSLVFYAETYIADIGPDVENMDACFELANERHQKDIYNDYSAEFIPVCFFNGREVTQDDIINGLHGGGELLFRFKYIFFGKELDSETFKKILDDHIFRKRYDNYTIFHAEALKRYDYDKTEADEKILQHFETSYKEETIHMVLNVACYGWLKRSIELDDKKRNRIFSLLKENDHLQKAVSKYIIQISSLSLLQLIGLLILDDKRDAILSSLFYVVTQCLKTKKGALKLTRNEEVEEAIAQEINDALNNDCCIEDPGEESDELETDLASSKIMIAPGVH